MTQVIHLGRNDMNVAKVRLGVPHEMVSVMLPIKHIEAMAVIKAKSGETRSEVIRNAVAIDINKRALTNATIRKVLRGK